MKLKKIFILIFICLLNIKILANDENFDLDNLYKVEIIVFKNNISPNKLYSNFDKLNIPKNALYINETQEDYTSNVIPKLYVKLSYDDNNLNTVDKKLSESKNYSVIAHYSWYQNINKKDSVYFYGGQNYLDKEKKQYNNEALVNFEKNEKFTNNDFQFLNPEWELEGFIELQKFNRKKIHVDMNLLINTPIKIANYQHYKTFKINQNMNTSLNDIMYFDNPYFGAIVSISKHNDY